MAPMGQTYVQLPHATHLLGLILIRSALNLEFCHGGAVRVYARGEHCGDAAEEAAYDERNGPSKLGGKIADGDSGDRPADIPERVHHSRNGPREIAGQLQ